MQLDGKRIMVTGAAGALGQACVREFAAAGAVVVAVDRATDVPHHGQAATHGGIDLADPAAVDTLFARMADEPLHGLANIAGGFSYSAVETASADIWQAQNRANLLTAVACSRAALPLLEAQGGAIVNVGAAAARRADAGMGPYAASKAGVHRLTEALAAELKDRGVRVNAVLPAILDTPANREAMPHEPFDRWVTPHALAHVIGFLLSDAALPVTGALLPVTGRV